MHRAASLSDAQEHVVTTECQVLFRDIFMLLLHSFPLDSDIVALDKFQGRRGWSKGPLMTLALAASKATFSRPSPCEEKSQKD